ncbi:hypothetical protein A1O3_01916 [Capronia epimyces CBS 606.96]|uniref:Ras-GAP domain-containing protein n=1 Tax=Capronia epimyces CBS 606.96 TaxID=1182542 RepID=W9Y7Q5_9EURO|nr:uncharacterized protein A1O3_01916 [Capronia epimyces CBS 606.96]EXJ88852.1 hypothetical protein A1O3_01916 [Capronia epimyces CBS 606.96]
MESTEKNEKDNVTPYARSRAPNLQRKSSRGQASSQDRHGKVFADHDPRTIRAVTPDSGAYTTFRDDSAQASHVRSPVMSTSRTKNSQRRREASASVSNTDEESTIDKRRRRAQTRPGPKEDLPLDTSPGSFISKTRKRLGSITTGPAQGQRAEGTYESIGFPSVVNGSELLAQADPRNPPRTPRRPFTPEDMPSGSATTVRSPRLLDIDSARILHLMKTTCGRMHGILFFRPLHTTAWASGYCAINVAPGNLVCQTKGEVTQSRTLIADLRGCTVRTHYDQETQSTYLSVLVASSGTGYQLRPPVPETFDSWLAALLCWQPLRPKGIHNKMTKPQPVGMVDKKPVSQRRVSDLSSPKSTAIVKVGNMLLWDGALPSGSQLASFWNGAGRTATESNPRWRKVSCTLHENGTLRLLGDVDTHVISVTHLSQLSRCAIQRLDESVLRMPRCIAIYPHYRVHVASATASRPMVLCLESNVALEAWFVLLRALTVPELYGPERPPFDIPQASDNSAQYKSQPSQGMFRIERSLSVKIIEAKFSERFALKDSHDFHKPKGKSFGGEQSTRERVYAEVLLDKDLRARTTTKSALSSAFWVEEFNLEDIPAALSKITVAVKLETPAEKEWTAISEGFNEFSAEAGYLSGFNGLEISSHDPVFGRLDVPLDELEHKPILEKWWPLFDNNDHSVGTILVRLALQETMVLLEEEYREISTLLQNFSNGLTVHIAHFLGPDLRHLSNLLLDIFQASRLANEWISNLIEEEIDGIYRDGPPSRLRFSDRIHSNDSFESAEQREVLVRDLSRSATMEANLLFRGNSLVTKVLDAHMRRLGKDYLEEVLGERLRTILERNPDCEVDPNRVSPREQLDKNWANLLSLTKSIWKSIYVSASRCPMDLRVIFRLVRSCAEDRYGSFIRTVKYTSVSGFLFLRFFCPAILNPKLFGLIQDQPSDRAKRTFTLIAKSLNVLANTARFGTKEPWMEPMNKFLAASTNEFKSFIDEICAVSSIQVASASLEPQFAAPNQIRNRLPAVSREGLPSLPFLLDHTKLLAQLVDLWISRAPENISEVTNDEAVRAFHTLCAGLNQKTRECLKAAEQAERPDENSESTWQQLLTDQQRAIAPNPFDAQPMTADADDEITALPQMARSMIDTEYTAAETSPGVGEADSTPSSSASVAWDRRIPFPYRAADARLTDSTNSSTASIDMMEEGRSRPLPSSRDGTSKSRLFELMSSSSRRKGKPGDQHDVDDDANEV